MKLIASELEFLAAWAREEWEPQCYQRPAHRLQLAHGVVGAHLIELIKAWTTANGLKDHAILGVAANPEPPWPPLGLGPAPRSSKSDYGKRSASGPAMRRLSPEPASLTACSIGRGDGFEGLPAFAHHHRRSIGVRKREARKRRYRRFL
jgi:hypothetical protein